MHTMDRPNNTGKARGVKKEKGVIYTLNGKRYRLGGNRSRPICIGDNDTCKNRADGTDGLCAGHRSGRLRTNNDGLVKGQVVKYQGDIRVFNGIQKVKVCSYHSMDGIRCMVRVQHDGVCKKHSPKCRCRFEGCDHIATCDEYCKRHENGVLNAKIKSIGESAVAQILDKHGIKYVHDLYIKLPDGKFLYLDFYLPDLDAVIEFDGEQHFKIVKYWKGEAGLKERQENDRRKNEWCETEKKPLKRIRYDEVDRVEADVMKFIEDVKKAREIDIVNRYLAELGVDFSC